MLNFVTAFQFQHLTKLITYAKNNNNNQKLFKFDTAIYHASFIV